MIGSLLCLALVRPVFGDQLKTSALTHLPKKRVTKVYILAGQSNMEGHGIVGADMKRNGGLGSLEYLAKNPPTQGHFGRFLDRDGKWIVRNDVFIHYLDRKGGLTAGFGVRQDCIGPEFGFGHVVGDAVADDVLLIKLAWGGKSLAVDFRPPSSGGQVGPYYSEVVQGVRNVLKNLGTEFPNLANQDVEIAGFGWHQGWNDRINTAHVAEYEKNMTNFIRDIRKDLGVRMPFVIAETGMGGWAERNRDALALMKAQSAVAKVKDFKGNVGFVPTRNYWREKHLSPSAQDYHWNSNAETYCLIGEAMGREMLRLRPAPPSLEDGEMAGYLIIPHTRVDRSFDAGFSMYSAAWPLLSEYPGNRFQTGLLGTWMFAQQEAPLNEKHYSDIEGGLGWWRDTRFATTTPKFIMGGVALDFSEWANGPGAGKGRDWNNPTGLYGVAQLSPWVVWPPDGLNLKQGTCGELFGYGYLPLPLAEPKKVTAGKSVPTGDQCWTLFLNTENFKGPVAFFTPYFFSKASVEKPQFAGKFLDSRPSDPNKAIQMETQHVPAVISMDDRGNVFARVAPTSFPRDAKGNSVLMHRVTAYGRRALWDRVKAWFEGGSVTPGRVDRNASATHEFKDGGYSTWRIYDDREPNENRVDLDWSSFASPKVIDPLTYGYAWDPSKTTPSQRLTTLPLYFRLTTLDNGKRRWQPISVSDVPGSTGLLSARLPKGRTEKPEPYVTPDAKNSVWKSPGPVAGPFSARLGDGSVITYDWYRFADQPAILNADMTPAEREAMQKKVEMIHRHWKKDQQYLPPNTVGSLASIDPALIVSPPKGLEVGYVPIVTRQGMP
ncbi:MAG TPA: sialate O-acetylesterase [Fimbriimonadaceae bacterium]|nr:sialate O-acetylesterase [Fimbriimonadaceae bacterium]